MACGKPIDPDNIQAAPKSVRPELKNTGMEPAKKRQTSIKVMGNLLEKNPDELKKMLDPKNKMYGLVSERLADALGANIKKFDVSDKKKIPAALKTLLKDHEKLPGLFEKQPLHRGPGSDSMSQPFELLSTAAIIQKGGVRTSFGTMLTINSGDVVSFGDKFPEKYTLGTAKKETGESDTAIEKKDGRKIGIDSKYTINQKTNIAKSGERNRSLEKIRYNFRSRNLHEFHYITNKEFEPADKAAIKQKNVEILVDRMKKDDKLLKESGELLLSGEKPAYVGRDDEVINLKIALAKIKKEGKESGKLTRCINQEILKEANLHEEKISKLVRKYNVPQIGIVENFNYD